MDSPATPLSVGLDGAFRRLDPGGRRADLWAWFNQAQGDLRRLWSSCPRGDWLAWWMASQHTDSRLVARACCECLRMAEAGVPVCLDSPRLLIASASAWAEERGDLAACTLALPAVSAVASDTTLPASVRAVALGAVWLGRFVDPMPGDDAPQGDAATEAYLAIWHAAAAISSEVNPGEEPGSDWWVRCLEAALGRFAEVIRGCVPFEELPPA